MPYTPRYQMIHLSKGFATALAIYLGLIALIAVQPAVTLTNALSPSTITITADGQATPIGKGQGKPSGLTAAHLELSGLIHMEGNGEIKISGLTGSLIITPTSGPVSTYTMTDGHGVINMGGTVEINGHVQTDNGKHKYELNLHGHVSFYATYYSATQGTIAFDSPQSKLSSLYFLSLPTGSVVLS